MPIDFSKINLSVLPKGGNVVKSPSRTKAPLGGRIDYGAIKLSNIYAHTKAAPKPAQKIPVSAVSSTPFIGRPLVTPVEQQRMKAATPTPPAVSRLTSKYDPQKYNPEVNPVAPLLQTAAVKRWSAEAAAARKATPEIGQRLLDGMDSFTKIIQPNITPREPGRNTVVDFVGSIATVAAGVYAVKSLLSTLGAGVLWLKTPRTVIDRETTTLFPRFDDSFQAQKYVLKLQQTDPAAAEKFKSDLVTLLAQTMEKDMPVNVQWTMVGEKLVSRVVPVSERTLQETASRMYDFLVSNGQAGSFATVGERFASATTAVSKLAAAVGNPQMSLAVAEQATNQLAKTGMLQLLPPLAVANRLGTIPMPAGLVHSTAPAIPMSGKTQPALAASTPIQEVAPQETTNLITKPWPKAPAAVARPVQAPAVKSYADIMAKEEAMGARLNTAPRVVDKTIPAIDVKKANLVDVTAKVDLKSVQVKFPTATNVFVDTKRGTVLFTNGMTPLEAIGVDKPQLKTWYGIEGAKLLGEITQPVQPVAGVATIPKQPWQEVIQKLPEEIQSSILKEVRGVKIVKGREAEGGRFDQNAGIVYVDESETKNPATLAHELMHAYVFRMANAPFIADFIKAKYLPDIAEQYLAENESGANYSMFSQEDVTVALTNYFFDTSKNKPEVNAVIERYYGTQPAPVVAQVAPALSKMETPAAALPVWKGTAFRSDTGFSNRGASAADVITFEREELGNVQDFVNVTPEVMGQLAKMPAKNVVWVTKTPTDAEVYGTPEEYSLPPNSRILAEDGDGGYLVLKGSALPPSLSTAPQIGTATTISNQKTSIDTTPPVSLQGGTATGAGAVKWGKWIEAVGTRRTSGVGTGQVDTVKTPTTYRLASGTESVRAYSPTTAADRGIAGPFVPETGKRLELKGDSHTYYITQKSEADAIAEGNPSYRPFSVIEARSGNLIGQGPSVKDAIGRAQETINNNKDVYDGKVEQQVVAHGEMANPVPTSVGTPSSVPPALITSTSAPASAPAIGNAAPAHGLIDYSKIELNGTTSVTSPAVLKSVSNTGKGFDNYIQNTAGTKDTSLSPLAKFKEGRDLQVRRYENQFDGLMKTPAGAEWMTMAIEADEILREEYARPFSINEAGERVYVEGEFAPAILNRYLKQYGPNFGKFLQHLQRAGISTETTLGLSAEKEALKQKHIYDARMSLVNFQKNEPQLFTAYMAAAEELGNANALLAEFYKGMISPETYANDKANPHYYVSLSAGATDVFDRSGVAPLERTHGLTDLGHVVPPLEGLKAVYVDAIRAQGINNAKKEAVRANPNSEVATTELSDSIVHLKENGVDKAYDVHDTNVTKSVQNLTLKKPDVPTWEKYLVRSPTTLLRLFATGLNPAFGLYNIMRDTIQSTGTVPIDPTGLVKGTIRAFKSPQLSQWFDSYRDPMMSKGARATEAIKKILEIVTFPNEIGEGLIRSITAETIIHRGGTYLDQLHGYYASTGFFALHGTFFNDFIASNIPFTRATIAVVRSAYRNTFYGLPIGDKGGTFSGKQGAEKLAGRNLATIIFTIVSALAVKEAGKEKEYKLLRDRASYFYFPTPSGAWVKLPVPIGFQPIKAVTDSLFGYKSDPLAVAGQTLNVLPGLESFMLPPALSLFLQLKFNINFFTGAAIDAAVGTPAANPLEAGIMKATGWTEERTAFVVRAFLADIPSQVQYVFDMVGQGSSTQAFPASKRFIVKDPTTSSNAAVDDFYALVDAVKYSKNPALEHYVNARASAIGKLLHNAKAYPAEAKLYMTTATDNIIATFATIAENPDVYGIKKYGPFSWRPSGNYEELAP